MTEVTEMSKHKTEDDFEAESDLRHLIEAAKIVKDKPRHKRAMTKAREQSEALKSVEKA